MRECKTWAHKIFSWEGLTVWRSVPPVFPRGQSASFLISPLNSFQQVLKLSSCWPNPYRGGWQAPVCSWQPFHQLMPQSCMLNCVSSVVSYSLWPYELYSARLLCSWDFPGKSTGMGCHALLQRIFPTQGKTELASPVFPALAGGFFITKPPGKTCRTESILTNWSTMTRIHLGITGVVWINLNKDNQVIRSSKVRGRKWRVKDNYCTE